LAQVPGYLIDRGLISPRSIVDGDLIVRDLSSRNHNFGAQCRQAPSYLLKQAPHHGLDTLANEAEVYRLLAGEPSMREHVPQFHGYDAEAGVLTLQYLYDAVDLAGRHRGRPAVSAAVARQVGAVLGALHRLALTGWQELVPHPKRLTYLTPHRPDLEIYRLATGAQLDLLRIIQSTPGFAESLDELARGWSVTAPAHHDARLINFLVSPSRGGKRRPRMRLIDWEFAGPGDPRWDIGSVLAGYLTLWLCSIPTSATEPPGRSAELATRPLGVIQPAMRACWAGYVEARGLDSGSAGRLLHTTVPFAAARLIHTAREMAQSSGMLTGNLVLHLQVAHNMLSLPAEAAVHLLGVGPDGGSNGGSEGGAQ
jgi:aminoglycoside phosphotransferase (APT) family kinase protein